MFGFKKNPVAKVYATNKKGEFQFYVYSKRALARVRRNKKKNYRINSIRVY